MADKIINLVNQLMSRNLMFTSEALVAIARLSVAPKTRHREIREVLQIMFASNMMPGYERSLSPCDKFYIYHPAGTNYMDYHAKQLLPFAQVQQHLIRKSHKCCR